MSSYQCNKNWNWRFLWNLFDECLSMFHQKRECSKAFSRAKQLRWTISTKQQKYWCQHFLATPTPYLFIPSKILALQCFPTPPVFSPWKLTEAALHGDFWQDVFSALIVAGCLPPEQLLPLERHVLTWTQCSGHRLWQLCFPSAWHGTTNSCLLKLHKLQASSPSFKDHNFGKWKSAGATLEDSVKSAVVCFSNAARSFSPEQLRHLLVWNLMRCSLGGAGH